MKKRFLSLLLTVCLIVSSFVVSASAAPTERIMAGENLHTVILRTDENGNVTILSEEQMPRSILIPGMILAYPGSASNTYTLEFSVMNAPDMLYTDSMYIRVRLSSASYSTTATLDKEFTTKVYIAGQTWAFPDIYLPANNTYTMTITSMAIDLYDPYGAYISPDEYTWSMSLLDVET